MTDTFVGPADQPDRYQMTEMRGRGGEGELWGGWVTVNGQQLPVAIKILRPVAGISFDQMRERVRDQAELLRSLEHPSLVKVREAFLGPAPHGPGLADGSTQSLYLVMNWATGDNLEGWIAANPAQDPLTRTRIVSRLSSAIDYMHSGRDTGGVPVVHRDIKPANVLVDEDEVRLVDFGLARMVTGELATIAGSPAYVAPEVLAGAPPAEPADRFGLGATAYFLFTGVQPDLNDPAGMRSRLIQTGGIIDGEGFADHILAMVDRDPARRPSNLVEWSQALAVGAVSQRFSSTPGGTVIRADETAAGANRKTRTALIIGAVAAVILLGGIGALLFLGGDSGDAVATESSTTTERPTTTRKPTTTTTTTTSTTTTPTTVPGEGSTSFGEDGASEGPGGIANPQGLQYLADFPTVDENYSSETGLRSISGQSFTRSVNLEPSVYSDSEPGYVEYDLGRKYTSLGATVGLSDKVKADTRMLLQVYADGAELFRQEVGLGEAVPLSLDMTDVLRLRLQATVISASNSYQEAVFGDIALEP